MPNYDAKETSKKGGLFKEDNRKSDRAPHYRGREPEDNTRSSGNISWSSSRDLLTKNTR